MHVSLHLPRQLILLTAFLVATSPAFSPADQPNIVVILCDDLGFGDLACYGHPLIRTPHLDRLAEQGVRFTNFYSAAPVCSPSRVGLLTGRSPNRAGVYDWIPPASADQPPRPDGRNFVHLRKEEVTLPALLKQQGYDTCLSGKWHCNSQFNTVGQPQPDAAGFDHWFATQNNAAPSHRNPSNFVRNGRAVGEIDGFSCQVVVDEVIGWLDTRKTESNKRPFFAYVAFHEPHEPVASPEDLVEQYRAMSFTDDQAQYFANVENLDRAAGRLLDALERLNVRKNTLVIFSSDNGPETLNRYRRASRSWGVTGPLRGMKLHTHDGGFHVAGIASWPGVITAGRVDDTPVSALDLLPTAVELAGGTLPESCQPDGVSLVSLLCDGVALKRTTPLVWAYYNGINDARVAMRHGQWKVLARLNSGQLPRYSNLTAARLLEVQQAKLTDFEIYDANEDPGETRNLHGQVPERDEELVRLLQREYSRLAKDSPAWPQQAP